MAFDVLSPHCCCWLTLTTKRTKKQREGKTKESERESGVAKRKKRGHVFVPFPSRQAAERPVMSDAEMQRVKANGTNAANSFKLCTVLGGAAFQVIECFLWNPPSLRPSPVTPEFVFRFGSLIRPAQLKIPHRRSALFFFPFYFVLLFPPGFPSLCRRQWRASECAAERFAILPPLPALPAASLSDCVTRNL